MRRLMLVLASVLSFLVMQPKYAAAVCSTTATAHCLQGSRFRVEVQWRGFGDDGGEAHTVPGATADSGLFYFFGPNNWEILVKVLDGCGSGGGRNDRFWVFAASATTLKYEMTVTDTETGEKKTYANEILGVSSPAFTDTEAFATCDGAVVPTSFIDHSGVNLPWCNYGWDCGRNPWGGEHGGFSSALTCIEEDFRFLAEHGVRVARVFIFTDLRSGIIFDNGGMPMRFDSFVNADFEALLRAARKYGLRLIPVLFDYLLADGVAFENGIPVGEHPDVISNPIKRAALITIFRPFIRRYGLDSAIDMFEVMNEPEFVSAVSRSALEAFIRDFIAMIKEEAPGRDVTVGARNRDDVSSWQFVGVTVHQFHYYDFMEWQFPFDVQRSVIPVQGPVLIGEAQPTDIQEKMTLAWWNGYRGILFWSMNADYNFQLVADKYKAWVDSYK